MDDALKKKLLHSLVSKADEASDAARRRWRRWRPHRGPILIQPYAGYGSAQRLRFSGRVLRDPGFVAALETHSAWRNIREFYKRLESDELPFARVQVRFQNTEQDFTADEEGYFHADIVLTEPLPQAGWQPVEVKLLSPAPHVDVMADAQVLVPPATASFGVISDIDDTVVQSNVLNKLRMLIDLARANHHTRKPFKGVGAFYRALNRGMSGKDGNPVFYVSSSPWNLYGPLQDFLALQGIPRGPLMLKDFGEHTLFTSRDHRSHKLKNIEAVIATYPHLGFILIGDSGEQDPEIYTEIVARHPNRILAIYIRCVDPNPLRQRAIEDLAVKMREAGVPLALAADSEAAAIHAAQHGWIKQTDVHNVVADKREDEAG